MFSKEIAIRTVPVTTTPECALSYAALGMKVFPLTANTNIPMKGSNGHLDATDDPKQITEWWTDMPTANIGIATGAVSGIWVLDIDIKDGKNGQQQLLSFLEARNVPMERVETKRVRTSSGGVHIYFKYESALPVKNRAAILGPDSGVDIRGDGGYVCAPPSVRSGNAYTWAEGAVETPIAEAPEWAYIVQQYDYRAPFSDHSQRSNKVDKQYRLPWDMQLDTRRAMSLAQTEVGQKYQCRCPHHDDKSPSAVFFRKAPAFGVLYCSACDTSWVTEKKRTTPEQAVEINTRLAQLKKQLKELT